MDRGSMVRQRHWKFADLTKWVTLSQLYLIYAQFPFKMEILSKKSNAAGD